MDRLTPRERTVFVLIGEGLSAKKIADILQISHKTVEFHKRRIFERLHVSSTIQLMRVMRETGATLRHGELRIDNASLMRSFRFAGWPLEKICAEFGMSTEQVRKIIGGPEAKNGIQP